MSRYRVILFEKGNSRPVEKFIYSLSDSTGSKIFSRLEVLEEYGSALRMPHAKRITGNLYELRIRGKEEVRLIYTFKNTKIYILHGFKKKRDRIPKKELEIAKKRLTMI